MPTVVTAGIWDGIHHLVQSVRRRPLWGVKSTLLEGHILNRQDGLAAIAIMRYVRKALDVTIKPLKRAVEVDETTIRRNSWRACWPCSATAVLHQHQFQNDRHPLATW